MPVSPLLENFSFSSLKTLNIPFIIYHHTQNQQFTDLKDLI